MLPALAAGCAAPHHPADWVVVHEVTPAFLSEQSPADPAIAADPHGRVAITFVTRDGAGKNLWLSLSRDSGLTFAAPVRMNPRRGSVASYPEGRPIAVFGQSGEVAVAWAGRRFGGGKAVDLVVRASGDGGATLTEPVVVNDDTEAGDRPAYHGFPALTFLPDGSLFAAWLDEREVANSEEEPSASALYSASSPDGGRSWSWNARLANDVCSCCRPVVSSDSTGRVAVAYRTAVRDLRDPALAVSPDGGRRFTLERVVSEDGWLLDGCPDQGPGLTWNRSGGGHYAWYTGAGRPGVYVMPWRHDRGGGGVKRLLDDSLHQARRPRLASLGPATLIAVEAQPRDDSTHTVLAVRALYPDGTLTPWSFLGADVEAGWICGVDRRTALACWVEREGERSRVRVVTLRMRRAG